MSEPSPAKPKRDRREYQRRWKAENRDKTRAYRQKYREANPDRVRELERQWRAANQDKIRQYARKYREVNAEKRRVARLQRVHGPDFYVMRAQMWDAQQGCCYLCGHPMDPADAVMDHWHGCAAHEPWRSCRFCRRGLAHPGCNQAIGFAGDDPAVLRVIADNLETANRSVQERQRTVPERITLF